jgi:hypothetical protein
VPCIYFLSILPHPCASFHLPFSPFLSDFQISSELVRTLTVHHEFEQKDSDLLCTFICSSRSWILQVAVAVIHVAAGVGGRWYLLLGHLLPPSRALCIFQGSSTRSLQALTEAINPATLLLTCS